MTVSMALPSTRATPEQLVAAVPVAVVVAMVHWGSPAVWVLVPAAVTAVIAGMVDAATMRIPNRLTAVGAAAVAAGAAVTAGFGGAVWPIAVGAVVSAVPLMVSHLVTHSRTPGLGDVKLVAVLGAAAGSLSVGAAWAALVAGLLVGAVAGLVWQATGRGRTFPLGPALVVGWLAVVLMWPVTA